MRLVSGPDLGDLTPGRLFPAPNLDARMRFIEAIDQCGRSSDEGIQADARILREIFEASADEREFLQQLAKRFTALESVPAEERAKPADGLVTGYATPVVRATRRA